MFCSLWLSPEHRQTRRLKQKIAQLSQRCTSDSFEPHVTISSGIADRTKSDVLRRLAGRHAKPSLAVIRVQHSNKHYQCLSLALRRDRELMALRIDALSSFGGKKTLTPYQPHITLLYAKLSASKRAKLARQIPVEMHSRTSGSKLQLVFTQGPQKQWRVLEPHQLGLKP